MDTVSSASAGVSSQLSTGLAQDILPPQVNNIFDALHPRIS
jgi:hypothetical protein